MPRANLFKSGMSTLVPKRNTIQPTTTSPSCTRTAIGQPFTIDEYAIFYLPDAEYDRGPKERHILGLRLLVTRGYGYNIYQLMPRISELLLLCSKLLTCRERVACQPHRQYPCNPVKPIFGHHAPGIYGAFYGSLPRRFGDTGESLSRPVS